MAKGSFNIGDEVAIAAKVRRRVTEDRVSVSIPSYGQPHSILDRTSSVDEEAGKITVNLGIPVTVNAETLRLVTRYAPPKRKTPVVDKTA